MGAKTMKLFKNRTSTFYLREWQRTVLLLLLLAFAIGFIYWTRTQYADNFVDTF